AGIGLSEGEKTAENRPEPLHHERHQPSQTRAQNVDRVHDSGITIHVSARFTLRFLCATWYSAESIFAAMRPACSRRVATPPMSCAVTANYHSCWRRLISAISCSRVLTISNNSRSGAGVLTARACSLQRASMAVTIPRGRLPTTARCFMGFNLYPYGGRRSVVTGQCR